jgi:hypothetical protein
MHLKAAIGPCGNDPDRVLGSVTPHVAIANPAFELDSWRIQVDRVAGRPGPLLNAAVKRQCSIRTPELAVGPITDTSALSSVTMTSNWAPACKSLGDGQAASAHPKKAIRYEGFQPTLLAQLFGETLDLRSEHLAARLREDLGEVAHDDKRSKPTPPRARQP